METKKYKLFVEIDEIKMTIVYDFERGSTGDYWTPETYDEIIIDSIYLHNSDVDITNIISQRTYEIIQETLIKIG